MGIDKSIILYEYSNSPKSLKDDAQRQRLEAYLKEIWAKRYCAYARELDEEAQLDEDERTQPFLRFDGTRFRALNFVGFIQFEGMLIEIYPKVFRDSKPIPEIMLKHLFFWLRYCRRHYFPVMEAEVDKLSSSSIPELLIWNFADNCHRLVSQQPFSHYEEKREVLFTPHGRIDFPAYIRNNVVYGNFHQLDCVYESFEFDNRLNRAIKYVCRLLEEYSNIEETKGVLREIIFILDEVTDEPCSATDLDKIILNPLFSEYLPIKEWCQRFLEQQLYSSTQYDSAQWCLLLPMEYVFEDFVGGFLQTHFSDRFKVSLQKSNYYLTTNDVFQLRHDIFLERIGTDDKIILDTKYKIRDSRALKDPKKGVAQADMYQMLSYAYRRGCEKVILLYPGRAEKVDEEDPFEIATDFRRMDGEGEKLPAYHIKVAIAQIPFGNTPVNLGTAVLYDRLSQILCHCLYTMPNHFNT